jgi:phenylacetate-CoA ligase
LRRATLDNPAFSRDLLGAGDDDGSAPPMIFTFNQLRTFIEVVERDANGYGSMTISMLDSERSLPLLRYQTGDTVRLLDREQAAAVVCQHGIVLDGDLPAVLMALKGREKDTLPNGSHVSVYKDALYADHQIARRLTGAFRLNFSGDCSTMHVQLRDSESPDPLVEREILRAIAPHLHPTRLKLWPYAGFPFGMGLDYERKFPHYVRGAHDPIGLL